MTYEEILTDLKKVGLKKRFVSEYESRESQVLLDMFKSTDKIHGTANLVRNLMRTYDVGTECYDFWKKVFLYYLTPEFVRNEKSLICKQ